MPAARSPAAMLGAVARRTPEWAAWTAMLRVALAEAERPRWAAMVPRRDAGAARPHEDACLLSGATVAVEPRAAGRLARRLLAAGPGEAWRATDAAALGLLAAALALDAGALRAAADPLGLPAPAVEAAAPLLAMPLLLACGRAWAARVPSARTQGHCPVCGAWPALAEARGLERDRRLRCGRCGTDWRADWLRCPFCRSGDHDRLASLVPGRSGDTRRVEGCRACGGYVKTLATLAATPPSAVCLRDLETVDLDVAALQHGFRRPDRPARPVAVRVVASRPAARLARWLAR